MKLNLPFELRLYDSVWVLKEYKIFDSENKIVIK